MRVAIIGCGYVGLTLAGALKSAGVDVVGVDPVLRTEFPHEPGLAKALGSFVTVQDLDGMAGIDAYIICVATPVEDDGALERATREVATHMRDGALVIVRSTVRVGTTRKLVRPILEASGKPFHLAYCPERTVEGAALNELRKLPQIVGADGDGPGSVAHALASDLFSPLIKDELLHHCSIEEAETAKLLANAWRSVTFAFANEIATLCEINGVSARNAIAAANWEYPRARTYIPRPGPVGGPCLPKDVELLTGDSKLPLSVIRAGAHLNNPALIATSIARAMSKRGYGDEASIAVLGTAFKGQPETNDTRDSPGLRIARLLGHSYARVRTVDPVAPADLYPDEFDHLTFDVIVVVTDHPAWGMIGAFPGISARLNEGGFVYDACGFFVGESPWLVRWGG